jgi:transcriptional regulator with XRE-family HTH domain
MRRIQDSETILEMGTAIRRRRKKCDLTQEQLAERSGLHISHISFLESGRRHPSWQSLCALSAALGIRPSLLMREAEDLEGSPPSISRSRAG